MAFAVTSSTTISVGQMSMVDKAKRLLSFILPQALTLSFFLVVSDVYSQSLHYPTAPNGKLHIKKRFPSKFVKKRDIFIWVPENYTEHRKYPVIYIQDGANLFSLGNKKNDQDFNSWKLDEIASNLIRRGEIRPFIAIGIQNSVERHAEYFPQKPWIALTPEQQEDMTSRKINPSYSGKVFPDPIKSDDYLKFIVRELKPFIDSSFSVSQELQDTFVMGASFGGLISIYALAEYPQIFGGAACLSTHWSGLFDMNNNPIPEKIAQYLNENLPTSGYHRIYFDHGTETLDALYPPLQDRIDRIMLEKGYGKNDWLTYVDHGAPHTGRAWSMRLDIPLKFLFKIGSKIIYLD